MSWQQQRPNASYSFFTSPPAPPRQPYQHAYQTPQPPLRSLPTHHPLTDSPPLSDDSKYSSARRPSKPNEPIWSFPAAAQPNHQQLPFAGPSIALNARSRATSSPALRSLPHAYSTSRAAPAPLHINERSHAHSPPPSPSLSPCPPPSQSPESPMSPPYLPSLPHRTFDRRTRARGRPLPPPPFPSSAPRSQSAIHIRDSDERRRRKEEGGERKERQRRAWWRRWCGCRVAPSIFNSTHQHALPLFSHTPRHRRSWLSQPVVLAVLLCTVAVVVGVSLAVLFLRRLVEPPAPAVPELLPPFNLPSFTYSHTLPLPVPPPSSISAAPTSILLFSIMRDFNDAFSRSHPAEFHRYKLALTSWLSLSSLYPALSIHVFVDSPSSCDYLRVVHGDVTCSPLTCIHPTYHRPMMHCVWQSIANLTQHYTDYAFVNGDILLFPSFLTLFPMVHSFPSYAVIAHRRDFPYESLTPSHLTPSSILTTQSMIQSPHASLHDAYGIDIFILSHSLFLQTAQSFPPFLIGIYRWDNWLLFKLLMDSTLSTPVIDATNELIIGHDTVVSDHLHTEGSQYNDHLCKSLIQHHYRLGNIDNADLRLINQSFYINHDDNRIPLIIARYKSKKNVIIVVPVYADDFLPPPPSLPSTPWWRWGGRRTKAPTLSPISAFLCNLHRLKIEKNILYIAEDEFSYWRLHANGQSNVILNRNRSTMIGDRIDHGSSMELKEFVPNNYTLLWNSLLYINFVIKNVLTVFSHVLIVSPHTVLLDDPMIHMNITCDLQSSRQVTSHMMLLTSYPSPHHAFPHWMMRKVEECQLRYAEELLSEYRKRRKLKLKGKMIEDDDEGDGEGFIRHYGLMGKIGEICVDEVVQYQLQPLPSFIQCQDHRIVEMGAIEGNGSSAWPYAIRDSAFHPTCEEEKDEAEGEGEGVEEEEEGNGARAGEGVVRVHVHVRSDATDQSIRLFLRSLVFSDYANPLVPPVILVTFDLTSLPFSIPPSPLDLSTRFSAILDDYADDVEFVKFSTFTSIQLASLYPTGSTFPFSFIHGGEEYMATSLIERGSEEGHVFVDSGMLMPRLWWRHWVEFGLRGDRRSMGMSLINWQWGGDGGEVRAAWVKAGDGLLGLMLPTSTIALYHDMFSGAHEDECREDSSMRLMQVLMRAGGHIRYLADVGRISEDARDAEGVLDARLQRVSGSEALQLEYQYWMATRTDPCHW